MATTCNCADLDDLEPRIKALDPKVQSARAQVQHALTHAAETLRQAESVHLTHPSLYQRAHGATIANEPAGIYAAHWQIRSTVRERQTKDQLAVEALQSTYDALVTESLAIRGKVVPQDKATVKELGRVEDDIGKLRVEVKNLREVVESRG